MSDMRSRIEWALVHMRRRAEVFEMFNQGVSPIDVVIQRDDDPCLIRDWFRAWVDMRELEGKNAEQRLRRETDALVRAVGDKIKELESRLKRLEDEQVNREAKERD